MRGEGSGKGGAKVSRLGNQEDGDESGAQRNKYTMRLKAKDFSIFLTTEGHLSRGV